MVAAAVSCGEFDANISCQLDKSRVWNDDLLAVFCDRENLTGTRYDLTQQEGEEASTSPLGARAQSQEQDRSGRGDMRAWGEKHTIKNKISDERDGKKEIRVRIAKNDVSTTRKIGRPGNRDTRVACPKRMETREIGRLSIESESSQDRCGDKYSPTCQIQG